MTKATMKQVELQDGASADIVQENVQHLKELFPDAFTENGVNFDTLRQLLGDMKVLDEGEEKYGLNWHGKKQARQIALTPSLGTLLPCPEESVDWDTTQNLFIEGDNLEVLKLLRRSYANKVKMIYIDPPYNTGKEFVYPDNFQDNLDTYLKYTGQVDDSGLKFSSNTETGGRKHTNWLNMMYPRLKLAKSLLRHDGVIFVSIDDHELANLETLMMEIFGEENGFVPFIWSLPRGINAGHVSRAHEYILGYAKNKDHLKLFNKLDQTEFSIDRCNKKVDRRHPASDITFPSGIRYEGKDQIIKGTIDGSESVEILGELVFKDGLLAKEVTLRAGWTMKNMILDWLDGKDIVDSKGQEVVEFFFKENGKLYSKKKPVFESPKSILSDVPDTQVARVEIEELFGNQDIFSYPKPSGLLQKLIEYTTTEGDLILDFFAGSCSTAQGLLQSNLTKEINRNYIVVQLPEKLDPSNEDQRAAVEFCQDEEIPENIAEIGKERLRRVRKKLLTEKPNYDGDLGFKVFKLASSNIKAWNPDRTDLEGSLLDHKEHLVEGRSEQDILYELLLKRGVDLTTPIETREIASKNVYSIGFGKIITCLDDLIAANDVEPLASGIIAWQKELKDTLGVKVLETHVFFKDSAFRDDVAKTNMAAILSQNGIDHVRSL